MQRPKTPLPDIYQYKLVMFDLDGTLVDSIPDLHAAVNEMLDGIGRKASSLEQVRSWVGNGAEVLVRRALTGDMRGEISAHDAVFKTAFAKFLTAYEQHNGQRSVLFEGVRELIAKLKAAQIAVAVITNKPYRFTLPLLDKMGLKPDHVLSGDSLPVKKPHPAPLLACMETFDTSPDQSLMIGDSESDINAARSAGCQVLGVSYGYNHGQSADQLGADWLIDSLLELG